MRFSKSILAASMLLIAAMVIYAQPSPPANPIHEITLPRYQPNLPPGPGRDAFATACLPCHSDRYISTQPPLPEAKWEAEVKKMVTTYGCYVTDEQVPQIAQYAIALQKSPEGKMIS